MKLYKIASITFISLLLWGCQSVLDKRDLNVIDDRIWDDENLATMYINKLYQDNMPGMTLAKTGELTDEYYSSSSDIANLIYGYFGPDDIDAVKLAHDQIYATHKENFSAIRSINLAIDGLNNATLDDSIKGVIKAQALFFRAYRHWLMVKMAGGLPMVLTAQDPYEDVLGAARSKTSDAIDILVADLDEAIESLPVDWTLVEDQGRLTKGAVAAFKGRILLAYASPLFNPENKEERWQRAFDANSEAINYCQAMKVKRALYPDFKSIFTTDVSTNTEALIYKRYDATAGSDYTSGWEGDVRPPSGNGSGKYNPTWEMVKAFPMSNGKFIEENGSGYDSTFFWQNRDPRFYATIAYNGCDWPMAGKEWAMAGKEMTTQWTYDKNIHENKRAPGTGFYNRKATDPTIAPENVGQTSTTWHELRYAEVLLNYAECANEIGHTEDAVNEVIKIRARAGIEAGDGRYGIPAGVSKEQLRALIMRERQVEFAFENKRYWDLRRRKMFQEDLGYGVKKLNGTQRHGLYINVNADYGTKKLIRDKDSEFYGWSPIDTLVYIGAVDINAPGEFDKYFTINYKTMEGIINGVTQSFNYLPLYNFYAITNAVLTSDTLKLEQTIGWIGGTFDPLAE